jgi:hypothetical protein
LALGYLALGCTGSAVGALGQYSNVTSNDNEFCVGGLGTAILYILRVDAEVMRPPGCAGFFARMQLVGFSDLHFGGKD